MKRSISAAVRIVVSALLLFFLVVPASRVISSRFPLVDVSGLPGLLRAAGKGYLLTAALLSLLAVVVMAWRWRAILVLERPSFSVLLRLTFIGLFFNNFLPTGAGGDIVKGYYFLKDREKKLDLGVSIILDRLIGTLSIMTMGFVAVLFRFPYLPRLPSYIIIYIFIAILFFLLLSAWHEAGRFLGRAVFLSAWGRPGEALKRFYYALNGYIKRPLNFLQSLLVSFGGQILVVLANYLVVLSLHDRVPLTSFFVAIPLIWSFSAVPSLGGLGIRETGYLVFFQNQMGKENAFALALIMLGFSLLNSLIGGLIYFSGGGQWQKKRV